VEVDAGPVGQFFDSRFQALQAIHGVRSLVFSFPRSVDLQRVES
jgi:hypothetical protein